MPSLDKMELNKCALRPDNHQITGRFEKKVSVALNTYIFRFQLPLPTQFLGSQICQCVQLGMRLEEGKDLVWRYFVPISRIDDEGYVDFLVRIYTKDTKLGYTGGEFTNMLEQMNPNQEIQIKGPYGNFVYEEPGVFRISDKAGNSKRKGIKYLGLISSGSGMTAFFQLMEAVSSNKYDTTNLSFLNIQKNLEEAFLLEELVSFHESQKLIFNLTLEEVN
eukprot:TRINITY_DN9251_c0_g2_i2.p1 TRINITY_DN9251_c0_g2~~TRINITY_DN9251_c0_g2_i2.p1  ORF type:complete len:220 (-),score=49.69 TRINITY_DN9251_c0_g2_i2:72-731(-)